MADLNKIVEELSGLTILEVSELVKTLEEKWGVSAAALSPPLAVVVVLLPQPLRRRPNST